MIIKDRTKRGTIAWKKVLPGLLLCLLGGLFVGVVVFISRKGETVDNWVLQNGFEKVSGVDFVEDGHRFSNAHLQSSEQARQGSYSLKITSDSSHYAARMELNMEAFHYAKVTVWAFADDWSGLSPNIRVMSKGEMPFDRNATLPKEAGQGWQLLELQFVTPERRKQYPLEISLGVEGQGTVYFDDFYLSLSRTPPALSGKFHAQHLHLRIGDEGMRKLRQVRNRAFKSNVLIATDDDWVNAKLIDGDTTLKSKARLKGDWLDHLQGEKWSFRLKLKKNDTWRRLKTFSLQTPAARNHLTEWVLHQWWEREDILTTRYDFVTLDINGEPRGTYAYEEHFEKQLLEYKYRREGPIVRFSEEALWESRRRLMDDFGYLPSGAWPAEDFEDAPSKPFAAGKTAKSPTLSKQFAQAQTLMYQYQKGLKKASEVFDIDQLAKYYAICDITQAHHATIWHNQRFYYNPVINRLEPIGYDGNMGIYDIGAEFLGKAFFHKGATERLGVFSNLAADTAFVSRYVHYLYQYTDEQYVADFINKVRKPALERQELLKVEFPEATFDEYVLAKKAKSIRALLLPYDDYSVEVFREMKDDENLRLDIRNRHVLPLRVMGTGSSPKRMEHPLVAPLYLPARRASEVAHYEHLKASKDDKYIFYQVVGLDTVMHAKIGAYPRPFLESPSQELFSGVELDSSHSIYRINGRLVHFPEGEYVVREDIIIPEGYEVRFSNGVDLDFVNGSRFISRSPVLMYGTPDLPVRLRSSDGKAGGFTVLQAKGKSVMQNVICEDFNTLSYKGWNLTGAVTFYESDVDIRQCVFTKNHCEDALNIIRSTFDIREMTISHTFSDGFDADFCKGYVENSRFLHTGNDGMDFSGSVITIRDCLVDHSGDKGISVGEESTVTVKSIVIQHAVLAVAAKDLSVLTVEKMTMENCQQGFAAFRKKPEYGGGTIYVWEYEAQDIETLHQIEAGSVLKLGEVLVE